jgi:fermentation-respiration switch protein FrsA (DUF1100 family)
MIGPGHGMIHLAHLLIVAVYLACPVVAVVHAVRARRWNGRPLARRRVRRGIVGGVIVGMLVCVAYAAAAHAPVRPGQLAITAYLATSFILLLGWLDRGLWLATQATFRLYPGRPAGRALGARVAGALLMRAALVGGVGIPYVLAVALTYRPKESPTTDPGKLYGWAFDRVTFPAAVDDTRIAGWWIPAPGGTSDHTLLLCPGATGGPAAVLPLVRGRATTPGDPPAPGLRDDGYNVLTFDFRGQGDSGGQLVSYGDLERRDVLGAVRWLQRVHPDAARHIVGLGVSTGAAALLAAAADPSPAGQSIDAVAVFAPFDRLDRIVASTVAPVAPPPLGWLTTHVALPLAGLQVGSRLDAFSPADAAANLWPRPVLVIHGMADELVPFAQGQAVYDAASEPKESLFIGQCRHAETLRSAAALDAVTGYFKKARRVI